MKAKMKPDKFRRLSDPVILAYLLCKMNSCSQAQDCLDVETCLLRAYVDSLCDLTSSQIPLGLTTVGHHLRWLNDGMLVVDNTPMWTIRQWWTREDSCIALALVQNLQQHLYTALHVKTNFTVVATGACGADLNASTYCVSI